MTALLLTMLLSTHAEETSTLFMPMMDAAENDRIQVIDQAIITTTEGLVHCDGVQL